MVFRSRHTPILPPPMADSWDWQLRARCRDMDSDTFFPGHDDRLDSIHIQVLDAKQICLGCPVLDACRDYALDAEEPHGIWGGMTAQERAALRGRRWARDDEPLPPAGNPVPPARGGLRRSVG
ncbi:WhiB family transcriptional regulator [Nocardia thailandica]|uniref:WhiB family transcriptional regulator n=1 Tax=Nocardia thailandica TaxID=257275 RepID=UPI000A07A1F5|nr:WhiB family transcriptional regulator [Nocardia thailandica]